MTKLGIVLPTYNEAGNLPPLVERLEGLTLPVDFHLFVVDDNSPDGTSKVAQELAARYGNISVITRAGKLGLGSALRDGIRAALDEGCEYILTMDSDLSHDPKDVPRLMEATSRNGVDFVQASRYIQGGRVVGWDWRSRFKSRLANMLCRWLLGCPMESTTNFRVYNREIAELVVRESKGNDFEFQPECILIAKQHGYRILEVPIVLYWPGRGQKQVGDGSKYSVGFIFRVGVFPFQTQPPTGL